MPVETFTANRGYELPDVGNDLDFDVYRLVNALTAIDLDVASAFTGLSGKSDLGHVHAIADVTGLQAALDGKSDTAHSHALDGLSNVDAPTPGTNHVLRFDGAKWISGALDAGWITLGTVAEARLPSWLSQANISAKADLAGAAFTGNISVSKTAPELKLMDGADEARIILSSGIAYLQAPTATGKLYLSSMFSADLAELKVKVAGAWQDILHGGNGVRKSGDSMTGNLNALRFKATEGYITSARDAGNRHVWFTDLAGTEKAVIWHNNADGSFRMRHKDDLGVTINELELGPATGDFKLNDRPVLHAGNGIEGVSVRLHGAVGDGVTDDTAAVDAAQSAAASAKLPLIVPAGSYLYNGTVYDIDDLSLWIDSGFTGGVNPLDSLRSKAILVTAETANTTPLDPAEARIPIGVTVAARGSHHASGIRSNLQNHSDDGQGCTAIYAHAVSDALANWSAALHGETRHAGGTSIGVSSESASYGTAGKFYGLVVNNTTNGAPATHPITGAGKAEHPGATAIFVQGTNDVDPMGAWFKGLHFGPNALRANAIAVQLEAPVQNHLRVAPTAPASEADIYLLADSLNGIVLAGTYGSGNAIRVPGDQAVAFENTGAKKLRWNTTLSRFELIEGNLQLSKVNPALWLVDGAESLEVRLDSNQVIFARQQAGPDDFANFRFDRIADYTGAGGVSSNVRIFTDVGANAGDGVTIEPEWALNTRIDSASAYVNAVAVSGQARRSADGAVWSGHFNTIDYTSPTSTKASRAVEANIQADGGDTQNLRTVLDVVAHNLAQAYGAGTDNIARGVRIVADTADFKTGLEITEFSGTYTEQAIRIEADATAILANGLTTPGTIDLGSDLDTGTAAQLRLFGQNSAAARFNYARLRMVINDATAGSERARLELLTHAGAGEIVALQANSDPSNPVYLRLGGDLKQVTVGAADSGGTGYRVLRVLN